jgi:hypothetical protein
MFVEFGFAFYVSLRFSYEIWFAPEKFQHRIVGQRKLLKSMLGFSFWNEGKVNVALAKPASIFALIISLLGLIVSITGPIKY